MRNEKKPDLEKGIRIVIANIKEHEEKADRPASVPIVIRNKVIEKPGGSSPYEQGNPGTGGFSNRGEQKSLKGKIKKAPTSDGYPTGR